MSRTISPQGLKALLVTQDVMLLNVRRKNDFDTDPTKLPGAQWKNPEQMTDWSKALPRDKDVVIYCARGGSVSNSVLDHLLAQGVKRASSRLVSRLEGRRRVSVQPGTGRL